MKNKGFTIVELLAVIVLLSVVALIAVPSIQKTSRNIKTEMCIAKKKTILQAAKQCYQDGKCSIGSAVTIKNVANAKYMNCDSGSGNTCKIENPIDKNDISGVGLSATKTNGRYNVLISGNICNE